MAVVRFVADPWPWSRQFPDRSNRWGDVDFRFDGDGHYDSAVVFGMPSQTIRLDVPKSRTIFVAAEPVNVQRYEDRFLAQFGHVVTTDTKTRHPGRVIQQVGLPWHVGVWDEGGSSFREDPLAYDGFRTLDPVKTKLASVVSSDKAFTPQHRERLEFVKMMRVEFGDEIDVFGRGVNAFDDKIDVLAPYRYHIALENCSYPHYWTEKISDPLLTLTFPIYHGAPNIGDYLPAGSYAQIDIRDPRRSLETIRRVIHSDIDRRSKGSMELARASVLEEHNLFAVLARIVGDMPRLDGPGRTRIVPTSGGGAGNWRSRGGIAARNVLPRRMYDGIRRAVRRIEGSAP